MSISLLYVAPALYSTVRSARDALRASSYGFALRSLVDLVTRDLDPVIRLVG